MRNILLIKLTTEDFGETFKQANLASKYDIADFMKETDFDEKPVNTSKKLLQIKQDT